MRYLVALAFSGLLIGGVSLYANRVGHSLQQRMRQRQAEFKPPGEISPIAQLDHGDMTDFGTEVSATEILQIKLLDFWYAFRMFLIPAVVIGSLIIAKMSDLRTPARPVEVVK